MVASVKVVHFERSSEGGGAVVMVRLHEALLRRGCDSRICYREGYLASPQARRLEFHGDWASHLLERMRLRAINLLIRRPVDSFSTWRTPRKTVLPKEYQAADIYHLHWIARWLDWPSFVQSLPASTPIVWTLHGPGVFTGGCLLYSGCHEFEKECGVCPLLKAPFNRWVAHREWQRKRRGMAQRRIHVVGNSAWTTGLARRASVFSHAAGFQTIFPGIEPSDFKRIDKRNAKELLGIAPNRLTLGFGCVELTDSNKNFSVFLELLTRLGAKADLEAIVFGNGLRLAVEPPVKLHYLGKLASTSLLSLVYSAIDLFVMTSGTETFGQVAIEAQACGTPVCAFGVGGLAEAVRHGETGCLCPPQDLEALAREVLALLRDPQRRRRLGAEAYSWVRTQFALEKSVNAYLRLYEQALADHA